MPRWGRDERDALMHAIFDTEHIDERSVPMDTVVEAGGVTREPKECRCGKPRTTLLVPSNTISYVPFDRETCRIGEPVLIDRSFRVTICLACDGGIEWLA